MTYVAGETVVTRKGKHGTVVRDNLDGTVLVRFGSREFDMRYGQVICKREYDYMSRGKPVPGQGR